MEARSVHTQPVPRESSTTEKKCMICMDNPINTIILPCGHQVCIIVLLLARQLPFLVHIRTALGLDC